MTNPPWTDLDRTTPVAVVVHKLPLQYENPAAGTFWVGLPVGFVVKKLPLKYESPAPDRPSQNGLRIGSGNAPDLHGTHNSIDTFDHSHASGFGPLVEPEFRHSATRTPPLRVWCRERSGPRRTRSPHMLQQSALFSSNVAKLICAVAHGICLDIC